MNPNFIEYVIESRRLLLVWQGSEGLSRSRYTVAELVWQEGTPACLRYLTESADFSAAREEGFISFPAFRKVEQSYDLGVVETLMRRLPPRTRGDYPQYLEQFRLRPQTRISDFALLAYTGAKLPSDGFSIIDPLDHVTTNGDFLMEVAGFRYHSQIPITDLQPGEPVEFVPDPENPHDPNAMTIQVREQVIGYVPRQQAVAVRAFGTSGSISARIERVNGSQGRPLVHLFAQVRP